MQNRPFLGTIPLQTTVISTGEELLRGRTVDTNAAFLAAELERHGFDVQRLVVVGDVVPIVDRDDSPDRFTVTQSEVRLDIGVLVERVLPPVEHDLDVPEQRSDPVRVVFVDSIRKVEKLAELLLAVRRNDLYVQRPRHATSIPCPRTPCFLPTRPSCSSTKSSCSSV